MKAKNHKVPQKINSTIRKLKQLPPPLLIFRCARAFIFNLLVAMAVFQL